MMKMMHWRTLAVFAGLVFVSPLAAQEEAAARQKVDRYHSILLKQPGSEVVFSRMFDAWLEQGTAEELGHWLGERAAEDGAPGWRLVSAFHALQGDDMKALEALKKAQELEPSTGNALAMAKIQARTLDFAGGVETLRGIEAAEGEDAAERARLIGLYLARAGRPDKAVEAWQEALAASPDDTDLLEDMVELQVAEGLYGPALEVANVLVEKTKDPYEKTLRSLRAAEIQMLADQREEAIARYGELLDITGEGSWLEHEVLSNLSNIFRREDDIAGLKEQLAALREKYPRRIALRLESAKVMAADGEIDEAVAMYREVLQITPGDVKNREAFIKMLAANERAELAIEELQALIKVGGETAPLLLQLADLHEVAEQVDELAAVLERHHELVTVDEAGRIRSAREFEKRELNKRAEEVLREAMADEEATKTAREALASFLAETEREEEALALWKVSAGEAAGEESGEALLEVARSLGAHGFRKEAYELLAEHAEKHQLEARYLGELIRAAGMVGQGGEVIEAAVQLVGLARSTVDLQTALDQASKLIIRQQAADGVIETLSTKAERSLAEACLLSELYELEGDREKAKAALDQWVTDSGADEPLEIAVQRVRLAKLRFDYERAAAAMAKLVELPAGRKPLYFKELVNLHERAGQDEAALAAVERWKEVSPGDKNAWLRHANLLDSMGRSDESVHTMRRTVAKFGDDEALRGKLATLFREAGDYAQAERILWQLYEEAEKPSDKATWAGDLATVAQLSGGTAELIEAFEERKRRNRKSVSPLLALAEVHRVNQDEPARSTALREASRRRPNDVELLIRIASAEEKAGELDSAIAVLNDAVAKDKTDKARRLLARMQLRSGNVDEGLQILAAMARESSDPREVEKTAKSMVEIGELESALEFVQEARAGAADDWRLGYIEALLHEELGDENAALQQFASLLEMRNEITIAQPALPANARRMGYNPLDWVGDLGPEMNRFFELIYAGSRAYTHRGGFGAPWMGGNQVPTLTLPSDVDQLHAFALSHIRTLYAEQDDAGRAQVLQVLESVDVPRADLLVRLDASAIFTYSETALDVEKIVGDDGEMDRFEAVALFMAGQFGNQLNEEQLGRVYEMTTGEVSTIAAMSAMGLSAQADEYLPWVEKGFAELQKLELESQIGLWICRSIMLEDFRSADGAVLDHELPKELRLQAAEMAVSRIEAIDKASNANQWGWSASSQMTLPLVSLYAENDLPEKAAAVIKDLFENHAKSPANVNPNMMFFGGRQRYQQLLAIPTIQQAALETIPLQIAQFLTTPSGMVGMNESVNRETVQKVLQDWAKESQNTLLQAMLVMQSQGEKGDDEANKAVREALERAIADEAARKDALRLAMIYEAQNVKDYARALQHAEALAALPQPRQAKRDLSALRVALAIQLEPDAITDEMRAALEPLVVQLRRKVQQPSQAAELTAAMDRLGMTELSERYAKLARARTAAAPTVRVNASGGRTSRSSVPQQSYERIEYFAEQGKDKQALREAARGIRQFLPNMVSGQGGNWELKRIIDTVRELEMDDAVIAEFAPGDSKSVRKRKDYALLCTLLDRSDEAFALFDKLRGERPRDKSLLAFALRTAPDDATRKALMGEIETIDDTMAGVLFRQFSDNAERLDELESRLDFLHALLEGLEPNDKNNLTFVNYLLINILQQSYFDGSRIVALNYMGSLERADKEQLERGQKIYPAYRAVAESAMKHAQTARHAAMLLVNARVVLKLTDEQLHDYALQAVTLNSAQEKPDEGPLDFDFRVNRSSSGGSDERSDKRTPLEYLMERAISSEDESALAKLRELLPEDSQASQQLVEISSLLPLSEKQRLAKAVKALKAIEVKTIPELDALSTRLVAFQALGLASAELNAEIVRLATAPLKKAGYIQQDSFETLATMVSMVNQSGVEGATDDMFMALTTELLGDADAIEALRKQARAQANRYRGPQQNVYNFGQLFSKIYDSTTGLVACRFLVRHDLMAVANGQSYRAPNYASNLRSADPTPSVASLREEGLITTAAHFDPIFNSAEDNNDFSRKLIAVAYTRNRFQKVPDEVKKLKGDEALSARAIEFSREQNEENAQAFIEALVAAKSVVPKWHENQKAGVAFFLQHALARGGEITAAQRKALAPLFKSIEAKVVAEREKLLVALDELGKAVPGGPLQHAAYGLAERANAVILSLLDGNTAEAIEVWQKLATALDQHHRAFPQNNLNNGVAMSMRASRLDDLLDEMERFPGQHSGREVFDFLSGVLADESDVRGMLFVGANSELRELGLAVMKEKYGIDNNAKADDYKKSVAKVIDEISQYPKGPRELATIALMWTVNNASCIRSTEGPKIVAEFAPGTYTQGDATVVRRVYGTMVDRLRDKDRTTAFRKLNRDTWLEVMSDDAFAPLAKAWVLANLRWENASLDRESAPRLVKLAADLYGRESKTLFPLPSSMVRTLKALLPHFSAGDEALTGVLMPTFGEGLEALALGYNGRNGNTDAAELLVHLAIRSGDVAEVRKASAKLPKLTYGSTQHFAEAIKIGRFDIATELLPRGQGAFFATGAVKLETVHFRQLAKFLETVEDEKQRRYLEIAFNLLDDSREMPKEKRVFKRLPVVLKDFRADSLEGLARRKHILSNTKEEYLATRPDLQKAVIDIAKGIAPQALTQDVESNSSVDGMAISEAWRDRELLSMAAMFELMDGDATKMSGLYDYLIRFSQNSNNGYRFERTFEWLSPRLIWALHMHYGNGGDEGAAFLPLAEKVFKLAMENSRLDTSYERRYALHILRLVLWKSGKPESEVDNYVAQLDEAAQKRAKQVIGYRRYEFEIFHRQMMNWKNREVSAPIRLSVGKYIFRSYKGALASLNNSSLRGVSGMTVPGQDWAFDGADLPAFIEDVDWQDKEAQGFLYVCVAATMSSRTKDLTAERVEEALGLLDKGLALLPEDDLDRRAFAMAIRGDLYFRSGDAKKAVEVSKDTDFGKIKAAHDRDWANNRRGMWKKKAAETNDD